MGSTQFGETVLKYRCSIKVLNSFDFLSSLIKSHTIHTWIIYLIHTYTHTHTHTHQYVGRNQILFDGTLTVNTVNINELEFFWILNTYYQAEYWILTGSWVSQISSHTHTHIHWHIQEVKSCCITPSHMLMFQFLKIKFVCCNYFFTYTRVCTTKFFNNTCVRTTELGCSMANAMWPLMSEFSPFILHVFYLIYGTLVYYVYFTCVTFGIIILYLDYILWESLT